MRVVDAGPAKLVVNTTDGSTRGWDTAVMSKVPDALRDQLGIAIAKRT